VNYHVRHSYPDLENRIKRSVRELMAALDPMGEADPEARARRESAAEEFPSTGIRRSILRDLRAGGARTMRGLIRLHKDWYHSEASELRRLLDRAGMPEETLNMVEEAVKKCSSCRKWAIKPIKPVARSSLSQFLNDLVFMDLLFYHRIGKKETTIFGQLVDDATRLRLIIPIPSKAMESMKTLVLRWISARNRMRKLCGDRERGIVDEVLQVWLELKNIEFIPAAGGPEDRHTQASVIESFQRTARKVMHKLDQAAHDAGVELTDEELAAETSSCCNLTPQRGGIAPCHSASGDLPEDPLLGHHPTPSRRLRLSTRRPSSGTVAGSACRVSTHARRGFWRRGSRPWIGHSGEHLRKVTPWTRR
jgi:hypothetical protein